MPGMNDIRIPEDELERILTVDELRKRIDANRKSEKERKKKSDL